MTLQQLADQQHRPAAASYGPGVTAKPWVAMSLIAFAASAERIAANTTGQEATIAAGWAIIAFTIAVVWSSRLRHRRLMDKHLRRRFAAALYMGAGWLTYVAFAGLSWGAMTTLLLVGLALSSMYLRVHETPNRQPVMRLELPPVQESDLFVQRWAKHLAADGQFSGSRLTDPEIIKSGYRYTLELVPGKHTLGMAKAATEQIRSGLRLMRGQEAIVEEHPDLAAPTAQITIVTKSTVLVDQPWPGPEYAFDVATGSVNMGPFVDGEGVARWLVYPTNGMYGGFMQGKQGSGKSRLLETIAVALASSKTHPTTVWFACGQGGASSKLLRKNADNFACNGDEFLEMLIQAEKVMAVHSAQNEVWELDGFTPGPQEVVENGVRKMVERRGLMVIADEFHNFTSRKRYDKADEIQERMARISREGRKAGVAIIAATQDPLLTAFGEGKHGDVLRSCLLGGNGVLLQSETSNAKTVFNVDINPRQFPQLPGYGYLARPQEGSRSAPFRAYYVNDRAIEQWLEFFVWLALTRQAATFCGKSYANRKVKLTQRKASVVSFLASLDEGDAELFDAVEVEMQRASEQIVREGGSLGDMQLPAVRTVKKFWAETSEPGGLTDSQTRVVDAIRQGNVVPSTIGPAAQVGKTRVHEILAELVQLEVVTGGGKSGYELVSEQQRRAS